MTDTALPARVFSAAKQITKLLLEAYTGERGIHAETVVCAASALTGEFCLRAMEAPLPAKGWIVGDLVNQVMFGGDLAPWKVITAGAIQAGLEEAAIPDPGRAVARTAAAIGGSPYPAMSVSQEHYPLEWPPLACSRFRSDILAICAEAELSPKDAAASLSAVVATLIAQTKDVLSPAISTSLALDMMVGVSRMAPIAKEDMHKYG